MALLVISFIAGVLTVLAPCILPLLPVIIGGSVSDGSSKWKPYVVTGSLAVSVILFTLILKVSTALISIPQSFWTWFSGIIILLFAITMLFPNLWAKLSHKTGAERASNTWLAKASQKNHFGGDILLGAALGPVFSTCSPTYFIILATVLPQSFAVGFVNLLAYALGLSLILLLISILGQKFANKLGILSNPQGWFKKLIGILFLLVGIAIITGLDKKLEAYILDLGFFDITKVENSLLENINLEEDMNNEQSNTGTPYVEIEKPSGYVNTDPITIGELVGKKVILIDFMTYSCINCQRTFPYLNDWYEKYRDDGLEIVGIHTPEFAFEKDITNVQNALDGFGIKFPVVLDNDYGTWRAYKNKYWPRKYLIDINGNIVYDHIGEGAYTETEMKIQELLKERMEVLGMEGELEHQVGLEGVVEESGRGPLTPEIYFGAHRNSLFGNGTPGKKGEQTFSLPELSTMSLDQYYLDGTWDITDEYARSVSNSKLVLPYQAGDIFMVAESVGGATVDVYKGEEKVRTVEVKDPALYTLIEGGYDVGTLRLEVVGGSMDLYTFTFGR